MRRKRVDQVTVEGMDGLVLDYYMTIDEASVCEPFGISIVKRCETDMMEEYASIDHIGADRQEICRLIDRLAKGKTFPVSLNEIVDDYLAMYDLEIKEERK